MWRFKRKEGKQECVIGKCTNFVKTSSKEVIMENKIKWLWIVCCCMLLGVVNAQEPQQPKRVKKVYYNAFSHNDYEHERPLSDALDFGFNCVEADLWLIDGELYVSHDKPEPSPEITFKKLYLEPLAKRIAENRGKVHPKGKKPFFLMVDCKSNGEEMLPVLKEQLEPCRSLFCEVKDGKYHKGAVLLFLSGDNPRKSILSAEDGYIFLDGRISDLGKNVNSRLMPVISDNYSSFIKWKGQGEISKEELNKMRGYIRQAHREGKLFRWYGAPDTPQFKHFFMNEGVDLVGADNLQSMYRVLNER